MAGPLALLKAWLLGPETTDGFGLSFRDELRFAARVRRLRRCAVEWRAQSADEARAHDAHPVVGRFGDITIAVAVIDGRCWIVRERMWFGWPDPPEYAAFALEGDRPWAAADFDGWPKGWSGIAR